MCSEGINMRLMHWRSGVTLSTFTLSMTSVRGCKEELELIFDVIG